MKQSQDTAGNSRGVLLNWKDASSSFFLIFFMAGQILISAPSTIEGHHSLKDPWKEAFVSRPSFSMF